MPDFVERPDGLPPVNGFSHVVTASGTMIFISGQVPLAADGTLAGQDVSAQAEQVFRNLQGVLQSAGVDWAQVVKLTYYLTDIADLPAVRTVRDRYLQADRLPASSLVQVAALVSPAFRLEIDAIAYVRTQDPKPCSAAPRLHGGAACPPIGLTRAIPSPLPGHPVAPARDRQSAASGVLTG